jgi:hypothetical protein
MQPTPRGQDSTAGLVPPGPDATPRELIAWAAAHDWAEAGPAVLAFAGQLSDAQAHAFLGVLNTLDTVATHRAFEQERTSWAALGAHMPGLAPAFELVRAHIQADQPACKEPMRGAADCRLAREVGYAG